MKFLSLMLALTISTGAFANNHCQIAKYNITNKKFEKLLEDVSAGGTLIERYFAQGNKTKACQIADLLTSKLEKMEGEFESLQNYLESENTKATIQSKCEMPDQRYFNLLIMMTELRHNNLEILEVIMDMGEPCNK